MRCRTDYRLYIVGGVVILLLILQGAGMHCRLNAAQGDEIGVCALFASLKSDDPDEVQRANCQFFAVERWPMSAVPILVAELTKQPTETLSEAVSGLTIAAYAEKALVKIGIPAVPALAAIVAQKGDTDARIRVLNTLARIGIEAKEAVPALLRCMNDQDEDIRYFAVKTSVSVTPEPGDELASALVHCLDDISPDVKGAAVRGLAVVGQAAASAVPRLLQLSDSTERRREDRFSFVPLRADVAFALGKIGSRDAGVISKLRVLLDDSDPSVRIAAALAYWRLSDDCGKALTSLKREFDDQSQPVRITCEAIEGLGEMSRHAGPVSGDLVAALRHPESDIRAAAVRALRRVLPDEYSERILPLIRDSDPFVRVAVIETLGEVDADNASYTDILIAALDDPDLFVRRASLHALQQLGGKAKKALPRLELMAASEREPNRHLAEQVIRHIRNSTPRN
jgi:HEAT repeat protein